MWTWRRNFILGVAAHPFRAVVFGAAVGAAAGVLFFALMYSRGGGFTPNQNADGWMRALYGAFGPAGGLLAISVVMFGGLGLVATPFIFALAWLSARQIRAKEAARAPAS